MTDQDQVLADFVKEFWPEPDPGVPISIERDRFEEWHNRLRGYRACLAAMEKKLAARSAVKEAAQCKCNLRTRLVGNGCEICNPTQALEYAKENIEELTHAVQTLASGLRDLRVRYVVMFNDYVAPTYVKKDSAQDDLRLSLIDTDEALASTAGVVKR